MYDKSFCKPSLFLWRATSTRCYLRRIVKIPIKARVRLALRRGHHTQRWLARRLGVSPQYIAMILNGRRTPSLVLAKRLEDLTGIRATDFIHSRAA